MFDILLIPIAILYLMVVGLLFIYGINFFYLTYVSWRDRNIQSSLPKIETWPHVTIQLPIYNEFYVVRRLVEAAAQMEYPQDRLEIQVLDDSTDETKLIAKQCVELYSARGVNIVHLHRTQRTGYKAGALAEGMRKARGEFFAIFDADFIPPADFLKRTIPHFQNPQIAFIQTRWTHVNRDFSLLTALQSLSIDSHFMVEQYARFQAGYFFNFNGTAGVWRRTAVQEAGGWTAETLTEDLDLSYRALLRGWKALYLRDVQVPAELPVSFAAYRGQQHRWASGSLQCAQKLLPQIWNTQLPLARKIAATLHLTGYGVHILLCLLSLLYPIVLALSQRYPGLIALFGIAVIFNATAFAPTLFFIAAQKQLTRGWWRRLPAIAFVSVLGVGMMLNTIRAALLVFRNTRSVFDRTPKFGVFKRSQNWMHNRYQLRLPSIVYYELGFACFNIATLLYAIYVNNWIIAVYAALFSAGLLFTSLFTIFQAINIYRLRSSSSKILVAGD
jgi:cellulose synthase/poly-beta-1,6-N-acetylglucosamine synthase-like glycosyltransferase